MGPRESIPNGISFGSAIFAELTAVTNTQTTLYAWTFVARIYVLRACDAR